VPIDRALRFEMLNANPVIVEISDQSEEFTSFLLFIILAPDDLAFNFKPTPHKLLAPRNSLSEFFLGQDEEETTDAD
jgi:hypothetical protein